MIPHSTLSNVMAFVAAAAAAAAAATGAAPAESPASDGRRLIEEVAPFNITDFAASALVLSNRNL